MKKSEPRYSFHNDYLALQTSTRTSPPQHTEDLGRHSEQEGDGRTCCPFALAQNRPLLTWGDKMRAHAL
eukprot:CAMPEP_0183357092 /NCGR_PEP_ID=MMETSP0164_2-20130417/45375_1 /TAXON_ID=221442 /ORGANISM="Coccolithus pelagicus ssp braarudi, Strain PLY182g" /LENGTH=68 /DNA_ID=CAMNT_0025530645 /DNA_START=206 /DNA_END=409 /DNA_ORIENTATION=-